MLRVKRDSSVSGPKRKAGDDDICSSIKRVRISNTPGEIRLNTDLKELNRNNTHGDVTYSLPDEPGAVVFQFKTPKHGAVVRMPSRFLVTVPKLYPHSRPVVKCLDGGFNDEYIGIGGEVTHIELDSGWSAVGSMNTVLMILHNIRKAYEEGRVCCRITGNRRGSFGENYAADSQVTVNSSIPPFLARAEIAISGSHHGSCSGDKHLAINMDDS